MFFNVIYFDEDLLERYISLLQPGQNVKYTGVETSAKTAGGINAFGIAIDKSSNSTLKGTFSESSNSKISAFEKLLLSNDYYADFIEGESYKELSQISKNMIIRISLPLYIPEDFDNLELIQDFKDQILDPNLYDIKKGQEQMFERFMDFKELKIPVFNDDYEKIIFSKLQKNHFEISTEELEDLESDVTILARVKMLHNDSSIELYNPVKDLFSFPRKMRRDLSKNKDQKLKPILIDNVDGLELDVIAIYS